MLGGINWDAYLPLIILRKISGVTKKIKALTCCSLRVDSSAGCQFQVRNKS